jgi:hypothetical protein
MHADTSTHTCCATRAPTARRVPSPDKFKPANRSCHRSCASPGQPALHVCSTSRVRTGRPSMQWLLASCVGSSGSSACSKSLGAALLAPPLPGMAAAPPPPLALRGRMPVFIPVMLSLSTSPAGPVTCPCVRPTHPTTALRAAAAADDRASASAPARAVRQACIPGDAHSARCMVPALGKKATTLTPEGALLEGCMHTCVSPCRLSREFRLAPSSCTPTARCTVRLRQRQQQQQQQQQQRQCHCQQCPGGGGAAARHWVTWCVLCIQRRVCVRGPATALPTTASPACARG